MKLLNNDGKRRFLLHVSAAKGGSASECTSAFFHLPYLQTWLYFRHVLVCKTWEFKAFTFSKWSMSRTLKEKTPGFSLPPPLWTWSWTLWGAGPGLRRMDFRSFSPWTRRSQSRSGVNSRATNPCEKSNCHPFFFFFFWLDIQHEDITQGKLEVVPPRLSGDSNYVPLWPRWWPFKLPHFSSLQAKIVWGYPCFWGASVCWAASHLQNNITHLFMKCICSHFGFTE